MVLGAAWLVAVFGTTAAVLDAPGDGGVTGPVTDWPATLWAFAVAAGVVDPAVPPASTERSAVMSLPWWTAAPLDVDSFRSGVGAWAPDVPAVVKLVVVAWAGAGPDTAVGDGFVTVLEPVPCWAVCPLMTLRAAVFVEAEELAGRELELPRSACGANPLLAVDEWATVVVSGWDVASDFTAELTGVVLTGWLATTLLVVMNAAFAGAVAALTGSLSAGAKDGAKPAGPLVAGFVKPAGPLAAGLAKPGENAADENGAAAPGATNITWCSSGCPLGPADST